MGRCAGPLCIPSVAWGLDLFPSSGVLTIAVVLGLLCGSFLNVVIHRLPRGLNLATPPSQCPHCSEPIRPWQNVPLLGWLALRGQSRCCGQPISIRYPIIEAVGGLSGGAVASVKLLPTMHEFSLGGALCTYWLYLTLILALVAAAAIDFEHMILPDSITIGGTLLGLATAGFRMEVTWSSSMLGALLGFALIWFPFIWLHKKLRGFPGMGLGDAKLIALAGAWLGPLGALLTLFAASLQGTLFAILTLLSQGSIKESPAVAEQRRELLEAIERAEGAEREALERELRNDPLALPPEEAPGGPRIAFGPFIALSIIELALFFEPLESILRDTLL